MNYNNSKLIEIALQHGYKTAKDFALFIKTYNPKIIKTIDGKETLSLSQI